jgi:ATP-dependent exoDNAse (exonuclease V) beta subunit
VKAPNDQAGRRRFAEELDRNFSVVAAAGSGKTRAITDRVVQIAHAPNAREVLPQLVVVTFTNRAADEMQQRTRQQILEDKLPPEVVSAFNRAFFGTIHSFCMKLLTNYGHYLGLPAPLELITDDEDLWQEFVQQQTRLGESLSKENRAALFRLAQARDIMELGRRAGSALLRPGETGLCPKMNFGEVHAVPAKGSGQANIINSKAELADWEERYKAGWEFLRWPICSTNAKEFSARWREAFAPLRRWVADAALCVAAEVQRDYRDFRLERGVVTYADQVALADELLQHPSAARRVREQNLRVILDEAQDTDPAQFSILLEITRPSEAIGRWLETRTDPPRPGHFCMVGDFQQSIYRDRADLHHYRRVHNLLVENGAATELTFSVTFRLDQEQVDFINRTFREILNDENGQVRFVELQPRPEVLPGQVIRVSLESGLLPSGQKLKDYQKAKIEADALARWIKETGLESLRASSWRDVAILCPRKAWLRTMTTALRKIELPVAIQSESAFKADSPAHAWLTALSTIMTDPLNGYEIVGVLREVFGISDHDLAVFAEGEGSRFRIDGGLAAVGVVSSRLRSLAKIRETLEGKSLFDAVSILVTETNLRERLASLPLEEFGDLPKELDALLALAAEAEAQGATLAEFAEKLRADFETPRDVRLSSENGIQLITSQKAKGSEWQAVIVPFLGRDIRSPVPRYPSLIKMPGSGETLVALSKEDPSDEVKKARELSEQQEMQRLLYVATTRARHTLVLAFDRDLFLDSKGKLSRRAQLTLLRGEPSEANAEHFAALASKPGACAQTSAATLEIQNEIAAIGPLPPLDRRLAQKAGRRAADFVRKFNPSGFDEDLSRTADEGAKEIARALVLDHSSADTPATLYGRWWHSLFQQMPWHAGMEAADKVFLQRLTSSPDRRRSAAEWKLVREKLRSNSTLKRFLTGDGAHAHAEFPFIWSINNHACVEGVIDLLVIDSTAGECLLVDWKTNRIKKGEEERLRQRYQPQVAAYSKAVKEITKFEVEAGIFATATGEFVTYNADELENEWTRLRAMPPDRLSSEILVSVSLSDVNLSRA